MSAELKLREIFPRDAAARVYPVAMGAARIAHEAGKESLAEELTVIAREVRYVVRRNKGAVSIGAHRVEPVKAAEVPAPFAAIAKEIARTDAWSGDSLLIGCMARSDGGRSRRLYASKRGKGVAYTVEPDVLPEPERKTAEQAEHAKAVASEKARRAERKAVKAEPEMLPEPEPVEAPARVIQATKLADLPDPDGVREMAKLHKDKGDLSAKWFPISVAKWDGQDVRVYARLFGNGVRYGISA